MKKYKLITFDLDDTLWPIEEVIVRAEKASQQWLQQHQALAPIDTDTLRKLRSQIVDADPQTAHNPTQMRKTLVKTLLKQGGLNEQKATEESEKAFNVFTSERNRVSLFDFAEETLQELQQHYIIGALSNGNADLSLIGIDHYFDFHFNAETIGSAKPDPAMFLAALEHARCDPNEAIHVGDHPEQDIAIANALGMRTVWIDHFDRPWPLDERPHHRISSLNQLLAVIASL